MSSTKIIRRDPTPSSTPSSTPPSTPRSTVGSRPAVASDDGVHPNPRPRPPLPPRRPPPLHLKPSFPVSHTHTQPQPPAQNQQPQPKRVDPFDLNIQCPFLVGFGLGATTWLFAIFLFFTNHRGWHSRAFHLGVALGICMSTVIVVLFFVFTFRLNPDVN